MDGLKYSQDMYIGCEYFSSDMEDGISYETEKLVKVRKEHKCVGSGKSCEKIIKPGQYAVRQQAVVEGYGWSSCYICARCIEEWLEESGQVETCEQITRKEGVK